MSWDRDAAAIIGIGATEFSKASGRSELQLATEAVLAALADAELDPAQVDGLVTFTGDSNPEIQVARTAGLGELSFFSRVGYGGGAACATVLQAVLAIRAGVAKVVVCYRAFNERSGERFGLGHADRAVNPGAERVAYSWLTPFGLNTPAQQVALLASRYQATYGATSEDFGRVAMVARKHAATNPKAWFYQRPITLAEHQASRWISEPLRLLDCCQESDGGQAIVVAAPEIARHAAHRPAWVRAAAQGSGRDQQSMTSYYRATDAVIPEMGLVARQLWQQSGLHPREVDAAVLYDHFTPMVLPQLEELGFCGPGEAADFIRDGHLEIGGQLPTNTHGGQLGEAYLHGMNGIAEGVRLVRQTSVNQPGRVDHAVVTAGTGVPTSGLVLAAAH